MVTRGKKRSTSLTKKVLREGDDLLIRRTDHPSLLQRVCKEKEYPA